MPFESIDEDQPSALPVQPPLSPYFNSPVQEKVATVPYPRVSAITPPTFPGSFGSSADSAGTGFMASRENLSYPAPDHISYGGADLDNRQVQSMNTPYLQNGLSDGRVSSTIAQPHIAYKERQDAHRPTSRVQPGASSFYPGSLYGGSTNPQGIPYLMQPLREDANDFDTI